jgi:hypothetical protein
MRQYQRALEAHLADYKRRRLGVQRSGEFQTKKAVVTRPHILPRDLYLLNILEPIRAELALYLARHKRIKLHKYFHHLNSSQALAFNLFFPFLTEGGAAAEALLTALGVPGRGGGADEWCFEYVPDKTENTNVDVAWRARGEGWTLCEVKLSEREFGSAEPDARHRRKLEQIYEPRLRNLVDRRFLELDAFVARYQLLRNMSLLTQPGADRLVVLLPRANEGPQVALGEVLGAVASSLREQIVVSYLEDILGRLAEDSRLGSGLREHVRQLVEKYVVGPARACAVVARHAGRHRERVHLDSP